MTDLEEVGQALRSVAQRTKDRARSTARDPVEKGIDLGAAEGIEMALRLIDDALWKGEPCRN